MPLEVQLVKELTEVAYLHVHPSGFVSQQINRKYEISRLPTVIEYIDTFPFNGASLERPMSTSVY